METLKLLGTPRVEDSDEPTYGVLLPLSRPLTTGERDAATAFALTSPAGQVFVADDFQHPVVADTTIEKIAEHREALQDLVAKIAADGEGYRKRAGEAQRTASDAESARQAERQRRQETAKTIHFG